MVHQFEADCFGQNILVWRMQADPRRRRLLNVRAMLLGRDISAFRPRPAAIDRQAAGLSLICGRGVGPARSANSNYFLPEKLLQSKTSLALFCSPIRYSISVSLYPLKQQGYGSSSLSVSFNFI